MQVWLAALRRTTAASCALLMCVAFASCSRDYTFIDVPADLPDVDDNAAADAGVAAFPDTGVAFNELLVARLVPDHGPFTGGTTSVIRGTGFSDESIVLIGGRMVQPAETELTDPRRLSIVVPAGDVGKADVTVKVGAEEFVLEDGFTYEAVYADPERGSSAGGTLINIVGGGTDFDDGVQVFLGQVACQEVVVVSATRITCRVPSQPVGAVDLRVVAGGVELVAEDGFTYYDTSDPFSGGLGGGPIAGTLNISAINAMTGSPLPGAFVIVGEDLSTVHQGYTNAMGAITFSGDDLVGEQNVHIGKHCFEKTTFVTFDASDVTAFMVPWMDLSCAPPGTPGGGFGRGRAGAFISGQLIWYGPNEYGPNPWDNIPPPLPGEVRVAYIYTTQRCAGDALSCLNPSPRTGDSSHRIVETGELDQLGDLGYPYRIFARPSGLAVYALAGLENRQSGDFTPYVMGLARNVVAGPGEEVTDVNIEMNIPLDHTLGVQIQQLPSPSPNGPDRFSVSADIDLGGEGVIVRRLVEDRMDLIQRRTSDRMFRFWAQPALFGTLSDGRYRIEAGWYTSEFETYPLTVVYRRGVRALDDLVLLDGFLGIPEAVAPVFGARLPEDRVIRWESDGATPSFHMVTIEGEDGNPAWRHFTPGDVREAPIPDLSGYNDVDDIAEGFVTWVVYAIEVPGFDYNQLNYDHLLDRFWDAYAVEQFTAQN